MEKTLKRLIEATKGCRDDMHEPDEQGIAGVKIAGFVFDNAMGDTPQEAANEIIVGIIHEDDKENPDWFNLCTLVALARKADLRVITPTEGDKDIALLMAWNYLTKEMSQRPDFTEVISWIKKVID